MLVGGGLTSVLTLLLLFFNMHDQGLFIGLLILPQSKQLQNFGAEHEVLCLGHGKFSSKVFVLVWITLKSLWFYPVSVSHISCAV